MPQPKRDAVHRYFTYDASMNKSQCNKCGNFIKGKHTTNLKNHYSVKHQEEYILITNINKENVPNQANTSRHSSTSEQIKNSCVKLVTVHGRPFALIQDKAFQEIINIALPSNAKTKEINLNVIKGLIPEKAYQIKLKIAAEVRNSLISLKLDSATYLDRNFLGINMQYVKEGKIIVRNLTVLEILERQTGDFLKDKVLEVLNEFMISPAQIYSVTTDNGSNFKKMSKMLTEYCSTTTANTEIESDEEDDDAEQFCDDVQDDLNVENLINTMRSSSFKPRVMFCAAHTLQLAVKDAIAGNLQVQICIDLARKAVKILRRPNMKNILKRSNLNKPVIDCPTRWSSTFQMLVRLVSLKEICDDHSDVSHIFSDDFWAQVVDLVTCLTPVNEATIALQREQLTISDFYIEWLNCKTKIESIGILFANQLVDCMKAREKKLLNTDLVLENLYLDGRLNVVLSEQECVKAQSLICETNEQLQIVKSETETPLHAAVAGTSRNNNNEIECRENNSRMSALEKLLAETEKVRGIPARSSLNSFEAKLLNLRHQPRVPIHENILAFWANKGPSNDTSLINVANCVLAAPATQVSVERLFSSVKFILNPLRSNISGSLLQAIMLVRSNSNLYD